MSGLFPRIVWLSTETVPHLALVLCALVAATILVVGCAPAVPAGGSPAASSGATDASPVAGVSSPTPSAEPSATPEVTPSPTPPPDAFEGLTVTKPDIPYLPKGSKTERKFVAAATRAGFANWYPTVIEVTNDRSDAAAWVTVRGTVTSAGKPATYEKSFWVMPGHSDVQTARVPIKSRSRAAIDVVAVQWFSHLGEPELLGLVDIRTCSGTDRSPERADGSFYYRGISCIVYNEDRDPVSLRYVVRFGWTEGNQRFTVQRCEAAADESETVKAASLGRLQTTSAMRKCLSPTTARAFRASASDFQFSPTFEYATVQSWGVPQ